MKKNIIALAICLAFVGAATAATPDDTTTTGTDTRINNPASGKIVDNATTGDEPAATTSSRSVEMDPESDTTMDQGTRQRKVKKAKKMSRITEIASGTVQPESTY